MALPSIRWGRTGPLSIPLAGNLLSPSDHPPAHMIVIDCPLAKVGARLVGPHALWRLRMTRLTGPQKFLWLGVLTIMLVAQAHIPIPNSALRP